MVCPPERKGPPRHTGDHTYHYPNCVSPVSISQTSIFLPKYITQTVGTEVLFYSGVVYSRNDGEDFGPLFWRGYLMAALGLRFFVFSFFPKSSFHVVGWRAGHVK